MNEIVKLVSEKTGLPPELAVELDKLLGSSANPPAAPSPAAPA